MERAARQGSAKAKEWLRTYKAGQEKFEHNQRWAESAVERELDAPRLAREAARLAQEQRSLKEAELLAHQRQNEKLLEDAAESGEAKNQFQLGVRFLQGDGVRKDLAKAIKWIRKSADKGDPEAQFKLADLYKNGIGVAQNLVESAKWCKQAAERGLVTAQAELGFNYMTGTGLTMDMVEAAKWFRMAAEQGLSTAQYNL